MIGLIQKRVMQPSRRRKKMYVKVTIGLTRQRRIIRRVKLIDDLRRTIYDVRLGMQANDLRGRSLFQTVMVSAENLPRTSWV